MAPKEFKVFLTYLTISAASFFLLKLSANIRQTMKVDHIGNNILQSSPSLNLASRSNKPGNRKNTHPSILHTNDTVIKDIYYIKVHKTGSTTMQNILHRLAVKHGLKVALFNSPHWRPFPDTAQAKYLFENMTTRQNFTRYNILCDHAIFHEAAFKSYMRPNLVYIATMREPFSQLESSFRYFSLGGKFNLGRTSDPIATFLKGDPDSYEHDINYMRAKNVQALSLGYTQIDDNNVSAIHRYLDYIDKKLNFVIISEHYDDGLVYMKNLFNWDLEDIVYYRHLSRQHHKLVRNESIVQELRQLHRKHATADYIFYEYFKGKTGKVLASQPPSFWDQVAHFKAVSQRVNNFCDSLCEYVPTDLLKRTMAEQIEFSRTLFHKEYMTIEETVHSKAFNVTFAYCVLMKMGTLSFNKVLLVHQFQEYCDETVEQDKSGPLSSKMVFKNTQWCDQNQHVVYRFPYPFLRNGLKLDECHIQ